MNSINFPLSLDFKIATFANDFTVKDADQRTIAYVRQKMLKLVDEIVVFTDETKSQTKYTIKANKWLDFSATYTFKTGDGKEIGRISRKGWASIWKAHYLIYDENQQQDLTIQEENGWVKVADAVLREIPLLGIFAGYFFNPSYKVTRPDGSMVVRLKKEASFFGRRFSVTKLADFIEPQEEERVILSLMMMILLERRRG